MAQTILAGFSTETDSGLALAGTTKTVSLGLATEAESGLAAVALLGLFVVVGLATEADSALAAAVKKTTTVGLVTEADSALAGVAARVYSAGLATEADSALAATSSKTAGALFLQNWAEPVAMETAWLTDVVQSTARLAEERRNLIDSPRRSLTIRWDGLTQDESTRLLFRLVRMGNQRLYIPLYQDVALTTASSSGTTINVVPTYRRFHVGRAIALCELDGNGRATNVQTAIVSAIGGSTLTISAAITGSYPTGSVVLPLILTEKMLEADLTALTDQVAELRGTFFEVHPSLPATAEWGTLTGFSQDSSARAFVFDAGPEWANQVRVRMARAGELLKMGRSDSVYTTGPRAVLGLDFTVTCEDRAAFWRVLQFFDAHRGRAIPFWVACPLTLWNPTATNVAYLQVTAVGDVDDYPSFVQSIAGGSPYLIIEKTDGTFLTRPVVGVTVSGSDYRLAVSPNLPALSLTEISRATLAFFCRFASDALRETWLTNTVAQLEFSAVELLRYESVGDGAADGFFSGGVDQLCALGV